MLIIRLYEKKLEAPIKSKNALKKEKYGIIAGCLGIQSSVPSGNLGRRIKAIFAFSLLFFATLSRWKREKVYFSNYLGNLKDTPPPTKKSGDFSEIPKPNEPSICTFFSMRYVNPASKRWSGEVFCGMKP